jgi:hypothetical protein
LSVPQNSIPTTSASSATGIQVVAASLSCRLKIETVKVAAIIAPSMKTSPWAKLISSRMP